MRSVSGLLLLGLLAACSGGGGGAPEAPPIGDTVTVSGLSPFDAACGGAGGTNYASAEVEPHIAADPLDANHLVGVWQQDRWSNGSSRGNRTGVSRDGGITWTFAQVPFSNCSGGNAANGGDYLRSTDPWVAFAPDGTVHQIALATTGGTFMPGSANAVLASRSTDGGRTWSNPVTILRNGGDFFSDKETITADPNDSHFVYAVWDRLLPGAGAPTFFARSTDGGVSWEPARAIFQPATGQTISNLIRVLPNGTLVNFYAHLNGTEDNVTESAIEVIRSTDHGATWSAPIRIAAFHPLGAHDPATNIPIRDGSIVPQMAVAPTGVLYAVWQDARFTGMRDGIAFSRSIDGGLAWSVPVRINGSPGVAAFTPQIHVRSDGVIGVTYFDLRSDTADTTTLLTDYWLLRSSDAGATWTETRVSPAFDIATAPLVDGSYFLGDYMGLTSVLDTFVALYARTTGVPANRTDIIATRIAANAAATAVVTEAKALADDAQLKRSAYENLARARAQRFIR